MKLDRLPPANQPAEVGQSRSGLLGFFRPQKTVSPWVQQGSQELSSATRFCAMPVGRSTAENVQEICPESGSNSAWSNLPEHLIEAIMQMLQEDLPSSASVQLSNKQAIQTQFAATSVSQSWRQIGRRTFFRTLWDQPGVIKHPVQMFGLAPEGLPTQLVKCVVKREYDTARPKAVKYTLRLGDKIGQSSFMMTALQVSRLDMKIFLSSSCQGAPCAHIETNLLGTKYEVLLDRTVQPFAQHQTAHSDTPLSTHDKLPSLQSMHSMRSASCDLDVPVVDLPSRTMPHCSSAAPPSAEADLEPNSPVSVAEPQCIARNEIPGDSHTNQQVNMPSPTASGSFLGRFKSARHSRTESPVQSPFAAMAEGSPADLQFGATLPPSGPTSPASPSFLARYQSAKDSLIGSRSTSSAKVPPTPNSAMRTSRIPDRSQSARVGNHSLPSSSCDDPRCCCHVVPQSVGGIQYKARIRGFMRPRRMKVSLPDPMVLACFETSASSNSHGTSGTQQLRGPTSLLNNPAFAAEAGPSGNSASHIADTVASSDPPPPARQDPLLAASQSNQQLASGTSTPSQTDSLLPVSPRTPSSSTTPKKVELRNKAPHWNDTLRCWCLNFRGRVKLASVKNFQLMKADDPSKTIVMQFGKVDPYTYIMDYNPAEISAVQAFAISLSTFDTKLLL